MLPLLPTALATLHCRGKEVLADSKTQTNGMATAVSQGPDMAHGCTAHALQTLKSSGGARTLRYAGQGFANYC
jgi:hypothetical protein